MKTTEEKLRDKLEQMSNSFEPGQKMIGNILANYLRFVPRDQSPNILRVVIQELEEALKDFDNYWLEILGGIEIVAES